MTPPTGGRRVRRAGVARSRRADAASRARGAHNPLELREVVLDARIGQVGKDLGPKRLDRRSQLAHSSSSNIRSKLPAAAAVCCDRRHAPSKVAEVPRQRTFRPDGPMLAKMPRSSSSAAVLLSRTRDGTLEVLLGHPGGPYFAGKDADQWSVLKGEAELGDDLVDVARREFEEETGHPVPDGPSWSSARSVRRRASSSRRGRRGRPRSRHRRLEHVRDRMAAAVGQPEGVPEVDRVEWFDLTTARTKWRRPAPFLDRLLDAIG